MVGRLFGTDGVRGLANRDITADLALRLAISAARILVQDQRPRQGRPVAIVGRDPRASGEFLAAAACAGLASCGVDVEDVGVLPTPAVAHLVAARGADLGVMLSASHNPMPDNGIKFFARGGHKLPDAVEDAIEAALDTTEPLPTGRDVGRIHLERRGGTSYVNYVTSTLPHRLDGLRVVVDCAHGAASVVGPAALRAAGADVLVIGADPNGLNINDGYGSTHLGPLQAAVVHFQADAGIAYDGDADRCLAVDATGTIVDGDQIMGILAVALNDRGELHDKTLVTTVMSNLGLHHAMRDHDIEIRQTNVGDRYVLEALREGGYALGGEQSGHVLLMDYATTGDGVLTSLHLLARMAEQKRTLADLASLVQRVPQILVNVAGVDKTRVNDDEVVSQALQQASTNLGDDGRVLLRPSGTEPVVRVMVEATDIDVATGVANDLADVIKHRLALN